MYIYAKMNVYHFNTRLLLEKVNAYFKVEYSYKRQLNIDYIIDENYDEITDVLINKLEYDYKDIGIICFLDIDELAERFYEMAESKCYLLYV